ncbi:MAG: potassium-transporting ATPase subunit KdpB [Desulfovibrio sp.]|jgi:K+-transporting ATPase ATPase B chain|nr:potassium-transporting ATPase subunit KdpB [Desulfovibrio sp.]
MKRSRPLSHDPALYRRAVRDAFRKLDPRVLARNPVMFVVGAGSLLTTAAFLHDLALNGWSSHAAFGGQISLWLWATVLFANFAEALAEGRGKAQADTLRNARRDTPALRLRDGGATEEVSASALLPDDLVVVEAGRMIPADGTVVEGAAAVDESAITGESAPVVRESGGDRSAVTGGTTVLSDRLVIRVTQEPGKSFLDRMIALVEGAERQKTPNEIALNILLAGLTIVFLLAVVTLKPFALFHGANLGVVVLVALLVCLIPTTIGGLLAAIGIAGMDRLLRRNVLAMSGRAVEAAGDVDVLLLDKTGTITLGNRMAADFVPLPGVDRAELVHAALLASSGDETPEGRSIVDLARQQGGDAASTPHGHITRIPFTAQTRMSGIDLPGEQLRKGATDAVLAWADGLAGLGGVNGLDGANLPDASGPDIAARREEAHRQADAIASQGGTPLVVASSVAGVLGVIHLKDVVKPGMRDRFERIRAMGIRTVMITGDNRLTAQAIAAEAGVDDYLAEAKPEDKLHLIADLQKGGRLVAMSGDGTNDAPALAQSDVGLVMNTGTQAAREAGNMIDLDSDPTKLIEIVEIGKQLLITRGALTTFSVSNDVAKYFAIIPALFAASLPQLGALDVMRLSSPESAVLSAVIFNALIIVALIPLALRGVRYRPRGTAHALRTNLLVYGLGGLVAPFVGIKCIDLLITALGLV